jgi:hypothetical protein
VELAYEVGTIGATGLRFHWDFLRFEPREIHKTTEAARVSRGGFVDGSSNVRRSAASLAVVVVAVDDRSSRHEGEYAGEITNGQAK